MIEDSSRILFALIAVLPLLLLNACSKTAPSTETGQPDINIKTPPLANTPIAGPMPVSLPDGYQKAEQVYTAIGSSDWASNPTLLTGLKGALSQLQADLKPLAGGDAERAGVISGKESLIASDLDSLERAIRSGDREAARREANRLTLPLAELAGMYTDPVPGEIMMLKYYSRQLDIAASTDDAPLLKESADDVRRTWNQLRPAVESHGGTYEAGRFNDLVRDLERSGPPGEIGARLRDRILEVQEILKQ